MIADHPAVKSVEAAASARRQGALASLLRYPDPEIEISTLRGREDMAEILPEAGTDRRQVRGSEVLIRQPIPFPGKGTVASRLQDSLAEEQAIKLRLLRNRMARDYILLRAREMILKQRIAYTQQTRAQVATASELASIQYSAGKGSLVDVASARVRENELAVSIANLETELAAIANERRYFEQSHEPIGDAEFAQLLDQLRDRVETRAAQAADRSLEMQLAGQVTRRAQIDRTLAQMELLPDFEVFTAYGSTERNSAGLKEFTRERMVRAGLNIRIPLWSALSSYPGISEKSSDAAGARFEAENIRSRIASELASSRVKLDGYLKAVKLHREHLIPGAMSAHQAARINYASGRAPFSEVVNTLSSHLEHELSLVEHELLYQTELLRAAEILDVFFEEDKS